MKEYPQFADRFKLDPTLTTYDIASPAIDIVAEVLEIDKKSVKLDHPVVRAYTDYAGPDGKGTPPSRYQLKLMAKKLPAYKETVEPAIIAGTADPVPNHKVAIPNVPDSIENL